MKTLFAVGVLALGAVGIMGAGGLMLNDKGAPKAAAAQSPFMKACLKSTREVSKWAEEELAKKGKNGDYVPTSAIDLAVRRVCTCGASGLKENLPERDQARAGETYGTIMRFQMGGYRKYAEKKRSKNQVKRLIKAAKRRERELKRWMVVSNGTVEICR